MQIITTAAQEACEIIHTFAPLFPITPWGAIQCRTSPNVSSAISISERPGGLRNRPAFRLEDGGAPNARFDETFQSNGTFRSSEMFRFSENHLTSPPNQMHLAPVLRQLRGALRPIVTKRGKQDAVDATLPGAFSGAQRSAHVADGEVVWVWRFPAISTACSGNGRLRRH
jgi:hypothetical protein